MNHDPYSDKKLEAVGMTLAAMSSIIHVHLPQLGSQLSDITDSLETRFREIDQERIREMLQGRGPMATLRRDLGMLVTQGKDLFAEVPSGDRLSSEILQEMVMEVFPASWTKGNEGGNFTFPVGDLPMMTRDWRELETGFYRLNDSWIVMLLSMVEGPEIHYVLCPLRVGSEGHRRQDYHSECVTYVPNERQWIEHQFYQVISASYLRRVFEALVTDKGYVPARSVSMEELKTAVKERMAIEHEAGVTVVNPGIGDRQFEAQVDHYHVTVIQSEKVEVFQVIVWAQYHQKKWGGGRRITWEELSPTKQQQFFEKLGAISKPPVPDA